MAKCPSCGEEIDYLRAIQREWCSWDYKGDGDYDNYQFLDTDFEYEETYECPECGDIIFEDTKKADEFLKSG